MPRKKKPFDKKNAQRFSLVHRPQQDPRLHAEGGSQYVLMPMNEKAAEAVSVAGESVLSGMFGATVGDGGGGEGGWEERKGEPSAEDDEDDVLRGVKKKVSAYDQVDEYGFPVDGYDYTQHLRPITGGAVFVSATGQVMSSDRVAPKQKQPTSKPKPAEPEILPPPAPPAATAAPTADADADADADAPPLSGPLSVSAAPTELPEDVLPTPDIFLHDRMLESIAIDPNRLPPDMQDVLDGDVDDGEYEELLDDFVVTAAEPASDEDEDGFLDKPAFDLDAHIARLLGEAKAEEEEELDDEALLAMERPRKDDHFADHLDVVLAQYGEDQLGELDDDDPRVQGSGALDSRIEQVGQEYLTAIAPVGVDDLEARINAEKAPVTVIKNGVIVSDDEDDEDDADAGGEETKADAASTAASEKATPAEKAVPFGCAEGDIVYDDKDMLIPRAPVRPKWDCETIISTYSNTENHPTVIDDGPVRSRKKRGGSSVASAEPVRNEPHTIKLSAKTGIPLGYTPRATLGSKIDEVDEEEEDEEEEEEEIPSGVVAPRARKETAEEKRARKQAVKEARRAKRALKKELKGAFKDEEKRQLKERGPPGPKNSTSVFKL